MCFYITFTSRKKPAPPVIGAAPLVDGKPTRVENIQSIKQWEGLRLKAYMPTPNDVPTIGYGHTKGVRMGDVITEAQAEAFLREDLAWVRQVIASKVKAPLSQKQYDALASFIFNIGGTAFGRSTMLRKLNAYDYVGAAYEFPRWNKQKGKVLLGLTRRRAYERDMFMEGTT